MRTYYYMDWFENEGFSEKLSNTLGEDITQKKSLVMISATREEYGQLSVDVFSETAWFKQADIIFDEYHLIDHLTQKEDAQRLIQNASVIFLCGGDPQHQKHLLMKNELPDLLKETNAVVMGTSAGGMNMSAGYVDRYADAKRPDYNVNDEPTEYEGIALNQFSFEAHFDYDNTALVEERHNLSEKMDIYMAADQNGTVRVKEGKIDVIGSVYLISHSRIQKLSETL